MTIEQLKEKYGNTIGGYEFLSDVEELMAEGVRAGKIQALQVMEDCFYQAADKDELMDLTNEAILEEKPTNHPTFYMTVVYSPEWQAWMKHQEKAMEWDVHESTETGWLSPGHFEAFLAWYKQ